MPAQQPQNDKQVTSRRGQRTPKLTLMKSYAAVSDDDLQSIVGKIRRITRTADARAATPPANPIDQSIDHPVDQSVDQSIGQSTNQSTIWPIERSNEKHPTWPIEWPNERPIEASNEIDPRPSPLETIVFNHNQAILYQCIYWLQGQTTSLQRVAQVTGISAFTLKHCLRKLRQTGAIEYHGRQNTGGRMGFSATARPCAIVLRGDEHLLLRRLEDIKFERLPIARPIEPVATAVGDDNGLLTGPMTGLMNDPIAGISCSSIKKQLLQDLVLEGAFQSLNPQSLLPHLEGIETTAELQDFIDMANACVAASRRTESPIRNPKGFLIAQLKVGFINPPDGYKSRRVRAQEERNRLLEAELEEIRRLKAAEKELELNVFRARLSPSARHQLEQETRHRVDPRSPLSEARQIEMAEAEILRDWLKAGAAEGDGAPGPEEAPSSG